MNRIENEQIRFYLEHEALIREWASLEAEVCGFVDRFYCSLKGDLDSALRNGKIAENGVESFLVEGTWPGLGLRRQDWPKSDEDPDVRLEWFRKSARFPPDGHLVCGVRTKVARYRPPFTNEACPTYPHHVPWWPAYKNVEPPVGKFWEGDNLKEYRDHLVETIFKAWAELAPLVDEAVGHASS